jgi:glycosyltransferase involved in cell wall biosynthesis
MRVAVVLHVPMAGGVSRFTKALVDGLLRVDASIDIGLFLDKALIELEDFGSCADRWRVAITPLRDESLTTSARRVQSAPEAVPPRGWLWNTTRDVLRRWPLVHSACVRSLEAFRRIVRRERPWYLFALDGATVDELNTYDLVYLPFPYWVAPAALDVPCVGTFHDFNQRHFPENFEPRSLPVLESEVKYWIDRCECVVSSTHFIRSEARAFYSVEQQKTAVVYVAPYSFRPIELAVCEQTLRGLGLELGKYVLYSANLAPHKNVVGLLQAVALLCESGRLPGPVVITGFGSQLLLGGAEPGPYVEDARRLLGSGLIRLGEDVKVLGYVDDQTVDVLTRSAGLVCSTSLYEAGCGPALDAWQFGVPVAMSRIPSFEEQMRRFGTEAWLFDPNDPHDIAEAMARALEQTDLSRGMAIRSQAAISTYTWDGAAGEYLDIFRRVLARSRVVHGEQG